MGDLDLVAPESERGTHAEVEQKHRVLEGKYQLGRVLGQGTFARVYHARNLNSGKSVAIKMVAKEKLLKDGKSIKREISVMKSVKHPNIVELYEVLATKSKIYLAMELVRGGELFAKVNKAGKLHEDLARFYFRQLISAVDFCHSRGVYHRDLKLENLLLGYGDQGQGNLKITDFGLSTLCLSSPEKEQMLHTSCGTPHYVAPEVVSRKPQGYHGSKADIWSCGVILYVLLAGYLPFHDHNLIRMYRKIYKGDFNCPSWFSPQASNLITRMLDPNPTTRITIPLIMSSTWYNITDHYPTSCNLPLVTQPKPTADDDNDDADDQQMQQKLEGQQCKDEDDDGNDIDRNDNKQQEKKMTLTLNAFHIISMSQGLDLSPLFEDKIRKERPEMRFATTKPAATVISRLKQVAAGKLKVVNNEKADPDGELLLRLRGQEPGRKGRLGIAARIYSLSPSLQVVELNKDNGDTLEYNNFCNNHLRPALKDIVWTS